MMAPLSPHGRILKKKVEALLLTYTKRVVSSQNTLHFDLCHDKHSVSHMPSFAFRGENYLFLFDFYYYCFFITFI